MFSSYVPERKTKREATRSRAIRTDRFAIVLWVAAKRSQSIARRLHLIPSSVYQRTLSANNSTGTSETMDNTSTAENTDPNKKNTTVTETTSANETVDVNKITDANANENTGASEKTDAHS
eukprot:jgi/Phyca11/17837/fgenesh1_pg.PHYCAscaffold_31_\